MSQPVTKASVKGLGHVLIDISNADSFIATHKISDLEKETVGRHFQTYFETEIKPEQKVFSLGQLHGFDNGVLTPSHFEIKTRKAEAQAVLGDLAYGDGAVMLFITLKGGVDGNSFPSNESMYLLPQDGGGETYTGALYLSSRVLVEKLLRDQVVSNIGNGIKFKPYAGGAGCRVQVGSQCRRAGLSIRI
ncbi:hypothetical protein [Pseudomonas fontis]|uniref:Uncharacterized protein n=1 Tax=Pseudomonas fontis TaxID=2942633 RepID=A0ABT5NTK9_9PSED|nr:hypothetical protein [Pseudomonas fontis]MDD0974272.1 hypothetical protein [Pseudomonas fontis]MDD0991497.1 hypothetical protein [Pseudomonas fontis]